MMARTPEQEQALARWKYDNAAAIVKLPKQLNLASAIVRDRIDGKRNNTVTLQLEQKLAQMGCPGFEQFLTQQKEKSQQSNGANS